LPLATVTIWASSTPLLLAYTWLEKLARDKPTNTLAYFAVRSVTDEKKFNNIATRMGQVVDFVEATF